MLLSYNEKSHIVVEIDYLYEFQNYEKTNVRTKVKIFCNKCNEFHKLEYKEVLKVYNKSYCLKDILEKYSEKYCNLLTRKEINQRYREKNHQKILESHRMWRVENLEKARVQGRNWYRKKSSDPEFRKKNNQNRKKHYQKNCTQILEKSRKTHKKFRQEHPDIVREQKRNNYFKHKEQHKIKSKEYRLKNKERLKIKAKQYAVENREKILEYKRKNKDLFSKKFKEWSAKNPEKNTARKERRRARLLNVDENFDADMIKCVFEAFENKCCLSGITNEEHKKLYKMRLTLDHVESLMKGNPLTFDNVALISYPLNCRKNRSGKEFYTEEQLKYIKEKQELAKKLYEELIFNRKIPHSI